MRRSPRVIAAVLLLAGCAGSEDFAHAEVVAALTEDGIQVVETGSAPGWPFSVDPQVVLAAGHELRVFEYADTTAREHDSSTILMGGYSVNGAPVEWVGPPHYWVRGRVIIQYLGDDEAAVRMVTAALGEPLDVGES